MVNESTEEELESPDEDATEATETAEDTSLSVIEGRIAALEAAQRQSVLEIRSAVGRVQSIQAKLDKTNDPQVEAKLRTDLKGVTDLLGLVAGSIDESILPRDVKQSVANAQEVARRAAADAEVDRRIAEATAPRVATTSTDTDMLEAAVISQIQGLGLNDRDPAFNWQQAAQILRTQGEQAMWSYFGTVERQLLSGSTETEPGPTRRTKAAPNAAATSTAKTGVDKFLDKDTSLADKLAEMRAQGILT